VKTARKYLLYIVPPALLSVAACEKDLSVYGTGDLGIGASIFFGIVAVAYLIVIMVWRWRRSGKAPRAGVRTDETRREVFEQIKEDRRFVDLNRKLNEKYKTAFEETDDFLTYRICYLAIFDVYGHALRPDNPDARIIVAYLRRKARPVRLKVIMDVRTGKIEETELGKPQWDAAIPDMR